MDPGQKSGFGTQGSGFRIKDLGARIQYSWLRAKIKGSGHK